MYLRRVKHLAGRYNGCPSTSWGKGIDHLQVGHVSDSFLASYAPGEPPLFRPGGLSPGKDVIFWMSMPKEGWHRLREEQPKENQATLMRNGFGHIFSGVWKQHTASDRPSFVPFVWETVSWREMPSLPDGVELTF